MGDAVHAHAFDLLHPEGVGPHPGDLLEVERRPLPTAGSVHPALHERPPLLQQPHADLEGLGLPDGVVDHVDPARVGHGQAVVGRMQHTARPRRRLLDERLSGLGGDHRGAEPPGQLGLGLEAGHHHDLDVGVQRPQDGRGRRPEGAGAVDEHLPPGGWRMPGDRVQRHGEGVGEDGQLVGHRVGHGDEHGVVGREVVGVAAGGVLARPGVDAGGQRARR